VTRRILATADPRVRARLTREVLAEGRAAAEKGRPLTPEQSLAVRYVGAIAKMQGRTS